MGSVPPGLTDPAASWCRVVMPDSWPDSHGQRSEWPGSARVGRIRIDCPPGHQVVHEPSFQTESWQVLLRRDYTLLLTALALPE